MGKFLQLAFVVFTLLILNLPLSFAQQWSTLGNESQISSDASNYTSIAVLDNVPYVVYRENTAPVAKVKKLNSTTGVWEQVGDNIGANLTYTRLYVDKVNNLLLTYVDAANGNRLAVKVYNAETKLWAPLNNNADNLYVSTGSVNGVSGVSQYNSTPRSSVAFDSNNTPYIAFSDGPNLPPYVKKFDGTSWVTIGPGAVDAAVKAVAVSLVIDETDVPWLVFASLTENNATTGTMALYKYANNVWTPLGSTIGGIRHTSMALNAAGNLTIAYFNTGNTNRATVIVYDRTAASWGTPTVLGSRDSPAISLIRDVSGNLYCSFIDAISSSSVSAARVFKQTAGVSAWAELKDPIVTRGIDEPVGNLTIAAGTEHPFIVYTKTNSSSIVTPIVRAYIPPAAPATITSKVITGLTINSAIAGGDIASDGGSEITERGVVYSTNSNPTVAHTKVIATTAGTGSFTVNLTGLGQSTLYYARAYAVNGAGTTTTYGNIVRLNTLAPPDAVVTTPKQMEYLNRGVVAVRKSTNEVFISWRLLGTDPSSIAFNIYRGAVKLNATPITNSTNFLDNTTANGAYIIKSVINGVEGAASEATVWSSNTNQLVVPLQIPAGGTLPDGATYTYTANDASVGDVDGDGEYEIFLKWEPTKKNDNAGGYSGHQIFDCYKLNGTRLWRIDLGKNMNAGPHYNQFMVYDFDGDGKAEIILKTADGTVDGTGKVIGDATVDYRNSAGWVQQGPEFLTVFNGLTGAAMSTVPYQPARGSVSDWGDDYGNRQDRFVSAVAYLDGARPSLVVGRGYYNKLVRAAYDWRGGQLTLRWIFDSKDPNEPANDAYSSQGSHQMTIGDVDGDGKDEVINGSSAINDNGKRLWTWGYGHGDALHMSDMDPDRPGQEIWLSLESPGQYDQHGLRLYDAKTGETVFGVPTTGDVGRGLAADVDPTRKGYEMWGSSGNLYDVKGNQIGTSKPTGGSQAVNAAIWWDGDLGRELLDGTIMDKWNPSSKSLDRLFTIYNAAPVSPNNDTKKNPSLQADLFGDWREEIILRHSDNTALYIFTTNIPTQHRIYTLMHDPQYRTAIAWQNSGYNQPPNPSFYLGYDMATLPVPNIEVKSTLSQTITFAAIPDKVLGDADFDPAAVASSGLPITYTSSNPAVATIVNGKIHIVAVGTTTITASQAGNSIYVAAPNVVQALTVIENVLPAFNLPAKNFKISATAETCSSSNNGKIKVEASAAHNYKVKLNGAGTEYSFSNTAPLEITNLSAGDYEICITVDGQAEYKFCSPQIRVTEPAPLTVYTSVNTADQTLSLNLSGSELYEIQLNGKTYKTASSTFTLKLEEGKNDLVVRTEKECQGIFSESLLLNAENVIYPNPFDETLFINLGTNHSKLVKVSVYSLSGSEVYSKDHIADAGSLAVNLSTLTSGLYIIKIKTDSSESLSKIIKK